MHWGYIQLQCTYSLFMSNKIKQIPKKMVGVKFPVDDIALIKNVASLRGGDLSDFLRHAAYVQLAKLSFLPPEQKKALGLDATEKRFGGKVKNGK